MNNSNTKFLRIRFLISIKYIFVICLNYLIRIIQDNYEYFIRWSILKIFLKFIYLCLKHKMTSWCLEVNYLCFSMINSILKVFEFTFIWNRTLKCEHINNSQNTINYNGLFDRIIRISWNYFVKLFRSSDSLIIQIFLC